MNILFLTNKSAFQEGVFGGAESSIRLLAEHLIRLGHSVAYVTKERSGSIFPSIKAREVDGTRLYVFYASYGYRRFRVVQVLNDWILERYISRLVEAKGLEIAYCFYELENVQLLLRAAERSRGLKVVMRMAGLQWYEMCRRRPRLIPVYEALFNRVDSINFISDGLQRIVRGKLSDLNMRVHLKQSFVADIGSSVTPGRQIPYQSHSNQPFRIIMATRFSNYQKRHDVFVKALALVRRRYWIQAKLIGSGSERPMIEKMVAKLGIQDRVEFVPFLPQGELWQELENTHLLCHACDYEGLGKIIIEGMAIGVPVLVSDVAPLNNFLSDGINGFLVANEPEKWAKKIEGLVDNSEEREKVSAQSIEWIKKHHTASVNVKAYVQKFEKIMET